MTTALLALCGCDCNQQDKPESVKPQGESAVEVDNAVPQAKDKAAAEASKPGAPPAGPTMSRAAWVDLVFKQDYATMTPEEVAKRFAPIEFRSDPGLPNSRLFSSKTRPEALGVGFLRKNQDEKWKFGYLRLDLPAPDGSAAKAWYEDLGKLIGDRLGQPKWIKEKPPYLARGFQLAEFDVNLGAIMNHDEGRPYAAIVIEMPHNRSVPK